MSTPKEIWPLWLDQQFWERLDRIESRHQRIQSEHDTRRRGLESCPDTQDIELQRAWQRYCEVIAELERTTAEFETLHAERN